MVLVEINKINEDLQIEPFILEPKTPTMNPSSKKKFLSTNHKTLSIKKERYKESLKKAMEEEPETIHFDKCQTDSRFSNDYALLGVSWLAIWFHSFFQDNWKWILWYCL